MIIGGMGGGAHLVSLFFTAGRLLGQLPRAVVALHRKEAVHLFDGLRIGTGHGKREKRIEKLCRFDQEALSSATGVGPMPVLPAWVGAVCLAAK